MSNYPPPGGYPPAGGSYPPGPPGPPPGGWAPPGQAPPGAPGGPGSGQWPPSGPPPQQQGPWQQPPPGGYGGPGYGGYNQGPLAWPKAGWFVRLGAVIIDILIISLMLVPAWVYLVTGPTEISSCSVDEEGTIQFGEPDNALCEGPTGATWAISIALGVAALAGSIAYWALLDGKRGQSLGKRALNIKVVDINSGLPIGAGRGVGRFFARYLSGLLCGLGYLWALWDDQHQAWHDKLVNSVVVPA
ncbi:MAG TPA: RDD family protein [Acidimicrobiales bacterium]|nr:RDD family protein [Acidimicrobiales bacterium]